MQTPTLHYIQDFYQNVSAVKTHIFLLQIEGNIEGKARVKNETRGVDNFTYSLITLL